MAKNKKVNFARKQLLDLLPKNSIGVEIGAWKGSFTEEILLEVEPSKLYIVDPYKFYGEYDNAWYGGSIGEQEKMDIIYSEYLERFKSNIDTSQLEVIRKESKAGLISLEDESVDFTYIDGNHTYEFVLDDLELSFLKVKRGGYITGDDYNLVGWWDDGVTKAVYDFAAKYSDKARLVFVNETQFAFKKF